MTGVDVYNFWASIIAGLLVAYTVAAHLRPRLAALALACLYTAVAVSSLPGPSGLLWGAIVLGGAALAGFGLRDRRRHVSQLGELAHQLELARDENARTAVCRRTGPDPARAARCRGHSVSVMVVQAGAAEEVPAADPDRAWEPLCTALAVATSAARPAPSWSRDRPARHGTDRAASCVQLHSQPFR